MPNFKFDDRIIEHAELIGSRYADSLLAGLRSIGERYAFTPIEKLFLLEAMDRWQEAEVFNLSKFWLRWQFEVKTKDGKTFKVDFAFGVPGDETAKVFVELDGHDFHEKTKEQVERDKKRERAIVKTGIPVLRFSGREVWRDPDPCVKEALAFITPKKEEAKNGLD